MRRIQAWCEYSIYGAVRQHDLARVYVIFVAFCSRSLFSGTCVRTALSVVFVLAEFSYPVSVILALFGYLKLKHIGPALVFQL